jgi:hypothetical protein
MPPFPLPIPGLGGGGGGGGGASSTVTVNNGPITVDSDSTVEVKGLNDIRVTARLEPTPLKSESKQELILPQPLKSEIKSESKLETKSEVDLDLDVTSDSKSALSVDLKPVAMDVCLNSSTKLPQGQIHQPFAFHMGMTWFGVEFFGFNFGGESRMVMQDLPKKPLVDWPAQQNAPPPAPSVPYRDDSIPGARDRGLRVRIK